MKTVLISGGSGFIGTHLCSRLIAKGYDVAVLSRTKKHLPGITTYVWNVSKNEIENGVIEKANYIIHLAGENIAGKRWTNKRRQRIIDSRVKPAMLLFEEVKKRNKNLSAFISASAVGYYGAVTSSKIFNESDPPANDFLGETCRQWEQAADSFKQLDIRTVKIRTGVVLANDGGALSKM